VFNKYPAPTKQPAYSPSKQLAFNNLRLEKQHAFPFLNSHDLNFTEMATKEGWTNGQITRFLKCKDQIDFSKITLKTAKSMHKRLDKVPVTVIRQTKNKTNTAIQNNPHSCLVDDRGGFEKCASRLQKRSYIVSQKCKFPFISELYFTASLKM